MNHFNKEIKYIAIKRGEIGNKSLDLCLKKIEISLIFDCDDPKMEWDHFILKSIEICSENKTFLLNLWGNKIIPNVLVSCLSGSLNLHPGLLPGQAGSHTITKAIIEGEICGASINRIHKKLDLGKVLVDCCHIEGNKLMPAWQTRKNLQESLLLMLDSNIDWILFLLDDNQLKERNYGTYKPTKVNQIISDKIRNIDSFSKPQEFLKWIAAHDFSIDNSTGLISFENSNGISQLVSISLEDIDFDKKN